MLALSLKGLCMKQLHRFLADESGATAIEYVLIGGFVSIAIIVGATSIGTKISGAYINKLLPALN
jgi:pilus assembly protein Flp/PilA